MVGRNNSGRLGPVVILALLGCLLLIAAGMMFVDLFQRPNSSHQTWRALSDQSEEIARKVMPSVVRVFVQKRDSSLVTDDLDLFFGDTLSLPREDLGSGMFIDEHGTVLTNFHVVRDAVSIEVATYDGRRTSASIAGVDLLTDLAIIKTDIAASSSIAWDAEDHVAAGTLVWAFGSPFGLDSSVTLGIISSTRNPTISDSPFQDFLQTDVAINPGSSGGPLVDGDGNVVGVNTAIAGDRFQGVSFALPSSLARNVADELRKNGKIERGWLGVVVSIVDAERARKAGLSRPHGVYIQSVSSPAHSVQDESVPLLPTAIRNGGVADRLPSSAPAGAGSDAEAATQLQAGDICLRINGRSVDTPVQFSRIVAASAVGSRLQLLIRRANNDVGASVLVAPRPFSPMK